MTMTMTMTMTLTMTMTMKNESQEVSRPRLKSWESQVWADCKNVAQIFTKLSTTQLSGST